MRDDVDRGQSERIGEGDRVAGHGLDGVGHGAGGGRYAGVVEQDDLAVAREVVAQGRVVVIHGAHEVLEEHQRRTAGGPEAAVAEACSAGLGVLGGGCVVGEVSHDPSVPAARGVTVSAA